MISEAFAKAQVQRLSGLPMYPEKLGRTELKRTLVNGAENEAHCEATVDLALSESQFCPTPFTLGDFLRRAPRGNSSSIGCAICRRSGGLAGMVYVNPESGVIYDHIPSSAEPAAMKLCSCRKGTP